eukprot:TRINITY_DN26135_c0_g1_i1.p1 TRINITY_DN26135_c0_g1~~TRINITY_DN26135_c0_g1_i1.p1  ORF type:complete len:728 (-),score=106.89 TRINITY_DN26135_c0_g1_i1:96-2279(-)
MASDAGVQREALSSAPPAATPWLEPALGLHVSQESLPATPHSELEELSAVSTPKSNVSAGVVPSRVSKASISAGPARTGVQLFTDFDEQLFDTSLYEFEDENEAETQLLVPHATYQPQDHGKGELSLAGRFSFVQTDAFLLLSGLVVIANITSLFMEITGDGSADETRILCVADQVCLVFYIVEVLLRLMHFRHFFFVHASDGGWNIFDLAIVCLGVFDQWVSPLITHEAHASKNGFGKHLAFWLPLLRFIRVLRFLRLLKLIGVLLRSDLRWTESVWFASLVSVVIGLSVILIGLETDIHSRLWEPVNNMILLFFVFELAVNWRKSGCLGFFTCEDYVWNCLDLLIVALGIFDQWALKLWMGLVYGRQHSHELGDSLMVFRLLRMLRILRVLRLVKAVQPLYILALGIVEAVQSMFWVLLLTLVALYCSGIMITRCVGQGACLGKEGDLVPQATRDKFKSVADSMFTLFVLMNGEDWVSAMPLLDMYPFIKFTFVIFIIISTWALLSVMTGVVSDNMIFAREAQTQKDDAQQGARRGKVEQALKELFVASGSPMGTGRVSQSDFLALLEVPFYSKKLLETLPLVPKKDLVDMFTWLEKDGNDGKVGFQEVLRGLVTLLDPISSKTLLQVDSELKYRFKNLREKAMEIDKEVKELSQRNENGHAAILSLIEELYAVSGAKPSSALPSPDAHSERTRSSSPTPDAQPTPAQSPVDSGAMTPLSDFGYL